MNVRLRKVPGTDIAVHPFAVDGSVFGWASGVEETARILDAMAEYGGNLVSTADHYAGGRSEVMIGSWLAGLPDRSQVVVATKIGRHPDSPGLSARNVVRATEASLQRLETDYVDFLTLDGVDEATPIDETLEAIDMLRRSGKVRYLAVSRYPAARLRDINELAETAVYPPVRLISVAYNLMQRTEFEGELAHVVDELGIGVVVRLPLASGFLSGGFRSKNDLPSSPLFEAALGHVGKVGTRVLHAIDEVAAELDESIGRIAIGWALSKPGVVTTAIQVKSAEQLLELAEPGEVALTRHQLAALDRASDR
ncbi:MAG TPA: aldo/keto reductase [Homoserinimonas sp.]|nr:aldo/keto reductase [Homoserinimonas sp.]